MTAFNKRYPVNSTAEVMHSIYKFVGHSSQDVVGFVEDSGQVAVWADFEESNGAPDRYMTAITSSQAFGGTDCFMVLEVQFANPGGRKWQVKIRRSSTTSIWVTGSPNGGWTIASATSGGSDSFGAEPTTGDRLWHNVTPVLDTLFLSSNDADTYDVSDKYGYIRAILWDQSATAPTHGFYVGGYIPFDTTNDTDPFLLLAGVPAFSRTTGGSTDWWGYVGTGGNNENRIPRENGIAVLSMASSGYAAITGPPYFEVTDRARTRRGHQEMTALLFVHGISPSVCVGTLGEETMTAISAGIKDLSINASDDRMAINNLGIRWEE